MKSNKRIFNLHSMIDMIDLAKYVQTCVYWGGYFIRKDDEESYQWKEFWNHLEDAIGQGHNQYVTICDIDQLVEFV